MLYQNLLTYFILREFKFTKYINSISCYKSYNLPNTFTVYLITSVTLEELRAHVPFL